MDLFGLTIARTKTLDARQKSLSSVPGSSSWWPLIREMTIGGWQRNEDVHVPTVLSNPTLYACITLIAGDIAKLRPKLVERDDDGIWHEIESPSFSPFLRKPNHYQSRIEFFEWWQLSLLCHGNVYALKARDGRGVVRAAYILDPMRVTPLVAPDGSVFYQLHEDRLSRVEESVVVPASEMFHDKECPLFHPLVGVSPIYAAGYPALQGLTTRDKSSKFFANGSRPGGVLTAPGAIPQETANRLKEYWETNFSGDNVGKIAVLGDGLKYEAMAVTAEQSQLVEQLRMTDEDIAKGFHMPRHKVGIGNYPVNHNIEALNQGYYSDCLQKRIEKKELTLDHGLGLVDVPGHIYGVEFDLNDLLRMDTAARMDAASKAISAGLSPNEVRFRYHDAGPVPGGDHPYMQQQNYSLEALARRDSEQPAPSTDPRRVTANPQTVEDDGGEKSLTLADICLVRESMAKHWAQGMVYGRTKKFPNQEECPADGSGGGGDYIASGGASGFTSESDRARADAFMKDADQQIGDMRQRFPGLKNLEVGTVQLHNQDSVPALDGAKTRGVAGTYREGTSREDWGSGRIDMALSEQYSREASAVTVGSYRSTSGASGTFAHELGHRVEDKLPKSAQREWVGMWRQYQGTGMARQVSVYGTTNPGELFAESFAAFTHPSYGGQLPAPIDRFMRTHIAKKKSSGKKEEGR
jgi:HK97 family phage portal protein